MSLEGLRAVLPFARSKIGTISGAASLAELQSNPAPLLLYQHLGLGDHILCNAIVREIASVNDSVTLMVRAQNVASVEYMFRDVPNLTVLSVANDREASRCVREWKRRGRKVMLNGMHDRQRWKPEWQEQFDEAFYRMADVPYEHRWSRFKVPSDSAAEQRVYERLIRNTPYVFIHDDKRRGFTIASNRLPAGIPVIRPEPGITDIIFHYKKIIEGAAEVHCISSSFAHWIENAGLGERRFLHKYVRRDGTWCKFRNFVVLEF
jgi:hypothetical protein